MASFGPRGASPTGAIGFPNTYFSTSAGVGAGPVGSFSAPFELTNPRSYNYTYLDSGEVVDAGVVAGFPVQAGSGITVNYTPGNASLTFTGYAPVVSLAVVPIRTTWIGLETLHVGSAGGRTSFIALEVLRSLGTTLTLAIVTWFGVEVLRTVAPADSGCVYLIC